MSVTLKEIDIDIDAVFKDPAAEAREWLEKYNEKKNSVNQWKKPCPECDEVSGLFLAECLGCGADLRAKCDVCGLPLSGEEPCCHCGGFESEEERKRFFRQSPRSKRANRPGGGRGLRWLADRRKRYGY